MVQQIFSTLAPIATIILIGFWFGKAIAINIRQLTDVSIYIFTSALVFHTLIHTHIAAGNILLMGAAIVSLSSILALTGVLIGKIERFSTDILSASLLCILFVNSGNMGLPFNLFAYGQPGLEIASLYLIFNAIMSNSLGVFIAARGKKTTGQALAAVFKLPLIYTVILGIGVRLFHLSRPGFIFAAVDLLQQAAVPLLLIILGIQIAQTRIEKSPGKINYVLLMRLIVSPVLAYYLSQWFGLEGLLRKVFIIQSSMPVAVNSAILAIKFDARPRFVANAVVFSTAGSILSLALVYWFLEML